jgi:hypothetical protein
VDAGLRGLRRRKSQRANCRNHQEELFHSVISKYMTFPDSCWFIFLGLTGQLWRGVRLLVNLFSLCLLPASPRLA